jgi:hypothetical protein
VAGFKFFAVADKLYINDKLAKLDTDQKVILDAWEISLEKIKNEKYNMGSQTYVAETVSLYTLPYLLIDGLMNELQDTTIKTREVGE